MASKKINTLLQQPISEFTLSFSHQSSSSILKVEKLLILISNLEKLFKR